MKFFVAFAALVAVTTAHSLHKPTHVYETPSILPAMVEDLPAVGPALVKHEYEKPAFGPAHIDFPINSEGGSPVVVGPVPEGSSPLVQIIVNVASPASEAGAGATTPSIKPELVVDPVQVAENAPEDIDKVVVADLPVSDVIIADLAAPPLEPILIGTPQLPLPAINIPDTLN